MPYRSCITVFFPSPLIFRYHLPLRIRETYQLVRYHYCLWFRHFQWIIPLTFLLLWIGMTWTLMMMCSTATRSNWRLTSCGRDLAGWFRFRLPFPVSISGFHFRFPFPFPVSVVLCSVEDLLVYPHLCSSAPSVSPRAVLRIRIRDPVHFWPLDPGWLKKSRFGIREW